MSIPEHVRAKWSNAHECVHRAGQNLAHPSNCRCGCCKAEEVWASQPADHDERNRR